MSETRYPEPFVRILHNYSTRKEYYRYGNGVIELVHHTPEEKYPYAGIDITECEDQLDEAEYIMEILIDEMIMRYFEPNRLFNSQKSLFDLQRLKFSEDNFYLILSEDPKEGDFETTNYNEFDYRALYEVIKGENKELENMFRWFAKAVENIKDGNYEKGTVYKISDHLIIKATEKEVRCERV